MIIDGPLIEPSPKTEHFTQSPWSDALKSSKPPSTKTSWSSSSNYKPGMVMVGGPLIEPSTKTEH